MAKPEPHRLPNDHEAMHLPPHANAEVHKRIMAHLSAMTPEEFLATLVRSGICTPDGKLTEQYVGDADVPDAEE
jgi:hypothetical protein